MNRFRPGQTGSGQAGHAEFVKEVMFGEWDDLNLPKFFKDSEMFARKAQREGARMTHDVAVFAVRRWSDRCPLAVTGGSPN